MKSTLFFVCLFLAVTACSGTAPAETQKTIEAINCGLSPDAWCPAPAGDPCGRHKNAKDCQADPKCGGMPYRGESVVACKYDERGFGLNCPTVGCRSLTPTQTSPQNSR